MTFMNNRQGKRKERRRAPLLRFSPYAWAKLVFLRDQGGTEVGGFGISAADDLLLIQDLFLVRQLCTAVTVRFDDSAVADFYDDQVDSGLAPEQFARIWIHTHPGDSARPSSVDEETFARCFGSSDWAVMFILARGGETFARLRFNGGPGAEIALRVELDFRTPFPAANHRGWKEEYRQCVKSEINAITTTARLLTNLVNGSDSWLADSWLPDRPKHKEPEVLDV